MDPTPAVLGTAVGLVLLILASLGRGTSPVGGRAIVVQVLAALSGPAAVWTALLVADKSVDFPPRVFSDWVFAGTAACVVLGLLAGGRAVRQGLALTLAAAGGVWMFRAGTTSLHGYDWEGSVAQWSFGLAAVGVLSIAVRLAVHREGDRARTIEGFLAFALTGVAASVLVGFTGLASGALALGALAGAAGLFGLWRVLLFALKGTRPPSHLGRAAGAAQAGCLFLLVAWGVTYGSTPAWAGGLVLAAPVLTLLPGGNGWIATGVRLLLVAAVGAAGPALELTGDDAQSNEDSPAALYR